MTAGGDFYVGGALDVLFRATPKKIQKFFGEPDFFGMSHRNFAISYPIFLSNSN